MADAHAWERQPLGGATFPKTGAAPKMKVMVCGVDCHPGDANCNNYCNHDKSKPMADHPPEATPEQRLAHARKAAHEKLREAEKALYVYYGLCEVGPERTGAAQIYENVRTATRL